MRLNRMASFVLLAGSLGLTAGANAGQWRDGDHVYQKVCGYCHEAGVGPAIKGRSLPEEYVRRVVRFGNRAMPAFRPSEIDDAALAQIAKLVSTSAPGAAAK